MDAGLSTAVTQDSDRQTDRCGLCSLNSSIVMVQIGTGVKTCFVIGVLISAHRDLAGSHAEMRSNKT